MASAGAERRRAAQASKPVFQYFPEEAQAAQSCSEEVAKGRPPNERVVRSKYFPKDAKRRNEPEIRGVDVDVLPIHSQAAQSCSEDARHTPQRAQVIRSRYFTDEDVRVRSKYFTDVQDVSLEKPVIRSKYFTNVDVEKPVIRSKYFTNVEPAISSNVDVEKPVIRSKYFTDVDVEKPVIRSKYFTEVDGSVEKAKLRVEKAQKCSGLSNGKRLRKRKGSENRIRIKKMKQETNELSQKPCRLLEPAWDPPVSPYGLIQERLYRDPWKMLIACMLLNRTSGAQMYNVIWDLFCLCPDAETAIEVETEQIEEIIRSLGLQRKRARMIQRFSEEYLHEDWTDISQLPGIGKYAADAYKIFYEGRWTEVKPDDYMLKIYWDWLHRTDGIGYGFTPELDA